MKQKRLAPRPGQAASGTADLSLRHVPYVFCICRWCAGLRRNQAYWAPLAAEPIFLTGQWGSGPALLTGLHGKGQDSSSRAGGGKHKIPRTEGCENGLVATPKREEQRPFQMEAKGPH